MNYTNIAFRILSATFFKRLRPVAVLFSFSYRCNLGCAYCGQVGDLRQDVMEAGEMSLAQIRGALDNLSLLKVPQINFSGGEPLLRDDFGEIAEYAMHKGFRVVVSSNGVLLTRWISELSKVDLVVLSLDGDVVTNDRLRGEGVHARCLQGIEMLRSQGGKMQVSSVLTAHTSTRDIEYLLQLCQRYDMRCLFQDCIDGHYSGQVWKTACRYDALVPSQSHREELVRFIRTHKLISRVVGGKGWCDLLLANDSFKSLSSAMSCVAGRLFLVVVPNGDLLYCTLRDERVLDCKIYENRFLELANKSRVEMRCPGCKCYGYLLLNKLAQLDYLGVRLFA